MNSIISIVLPSILSFLSSGMALLPSSPLPVTMWILISLALNGISLFLAILYLIRRSKESTHSKAYPTGKVIWLTGLSGAGKSTIAVELCHSLRAAGLSVEHLDGDSVREIFPSTGFSETDRNEHIRRIGYLASILEKHGITVVCSFISPYQSSRTFVRRLCKNFIEVYVSTPLAICEKRDVKGLYAKARRNEISSFTGVASPYEAPENPEIKIDTSEISVSEATFRILSKIEMNPVISNN